MTIPRHLRLKMMQKSLKTILVHFYLLSQFPYLPYIVKASLSEDLIPLSPTLVLLTYTHGGLRTKFINGMQRMQLPDLLEPKAKK